ncbi:LacI family DNA-binding transcriptional regulator [Ruminococcus sp.]
MTMQEIADAEGVSKSTVSRTIGLARKRISCGMKPAMLKSALKGR